jgi:hypothetical protein
MNKLIKYFVVLLLVPVLASCGGSEAPKVEMEFDETDTATAVIIEELHHVKKNLEELIQFYGLLKTKNYPFDDSYLLGMDHPLGSKQKEALALGAYGADMSYSSIFDQSQVATKYAERIVRLAQDMGLGNAFSADRMNLLASSDPDVNKMHILTAAYLDATDQLHSEERSQYVALLIVGGWMEGLHISSTLVANKPGDPEINLDVYDQIYSYHTSLKVLDAFPDKADCKTVADELRANEPTFKELLSTRGNLSPRDMRELNEMMLRIRNGFLGLGEQ